MCPMPGDDETPSAIPRPRPSHHPGPGYVANAKAPDFELDAPLRDAAARWLNLVPAGHRHEDRESAKDALETLREHTRSCPDHPLGALWVAHRHLRDPVPAVRIASLVLASEALWWLGHFEDARRAAQAAADADPASAQALWRLAVALYRQGRFEEAGERLDSLLEVASRFAPGWAAIRTMCLAAWAETSLRGHARGSRSGRGSFFINGTSRTSARTGRLCARRSGSRWPSFSTRP